MPVDYHSTCFSMSFRSRMWRQSDQITTQNVIEYSNIEMLKLVKNTIACLQPIDQGNLYVVKVNSKQIWVESWFHISGCRLGLSLHLKEVGHQGSHFALVRELQELYQEITGNYFVKLQFENPKLWEVTDHDVNFAPILPDDCKNMYHQLTTDQSPSDQSPDQSPSDLTNADKDTLWIKIPSEWSQ